MRFVCALLLCSCATASSLRDTGAAGLRSIRGEALSARIRFLSDDLLEGRFSGTRGHAIAERYVPASCSSSAWNRRARTAAISSRCR